MIRSPVARLSLFGLLAVAACSQDMPDNAQSADPAPPEAADAADPAAGDASFDEAAVRAFLRAYAGQSGASRETMPGATIAALPGTDAVVAYLTGPFFCGTGGCSLLILRPQGDSFEIVGDISVVRPPVRMLETRSNGLPDLAVRVAGGGAEAHDARLSFDGTAYPRNPTVAPAEPIDEPAGTVLIGAEATGRPLHE